MSGEAVLLQLAGVRLGVLRPDVHASCGPPDRAFNRWQSPHPTEVWHAKGLFVTYDSRDRVMHVEVAEGDPTAAGVSLLRRPLEDVELELAEADLEFVGGPPSMSGGTIVGWGVGLYVEGGVVKAVVIGQ